MKKITLWSVVLILITALAVAAIWWLRKPQIIQVDKNTKLTLVGIDYGKHHVFKGVKSGARVEGRATLDTPEDSIVVWVKAEHKPNDYPNFQLLVYDKADTACVSSWSQMNTQVKNGVDILGFTLAAFPRRESKLVLRVQSWGNTGQKIAKEQFIVSNPARGKSFPTWKPDALPNTQTDGDLSVTLTKMDNNARGFNGGGGSSKDPFNKAVSVAFHTEQNGVVVTNWEPVRIGTSDATGNQVENNSWSSSRDSATGDATMTYQWGLWPDEPAWKLRVEMSRSSGFSDDELWSVTNVPVNPGKQNDFWNYGNNNRRSGTNQPFAETTLNGVHLKLFPAMQFTDTGNGEKRGGFRIQADPPPEGTRMTIVSLTDEQGRKLQSWNSGGGSGSYGFQLQNMRNAKFLNLTIALHKSRFVEFTVKPSK